METLKFKNSYLEENSQNYFFEKIRKKCKNFKQNSLLKNFKGMLLRFPKQGRISLMKNKILNKISLDLKNRGFKKWLPIFTRLKNFQRKTVPKTPNILNSFNLYVP